MDPRSPAAYMTLGLALMCGKRDGASEAFQRALALAPDIHPAAYVLGGLLTTRGDLEGAARAFHRFASLTGMDPSIFETYLGAVVDPAKRPEAVAALQERPFFGSVQGAELLAQLGEIDVSLELLGRAVEERSPYLPWVNAMPQYDTLRSDPRFQAILAWVKFSNGS
jgi:tetratricopeptide (TPR) repeat protein